MRLVAAIAVAYALLLAANAAAMACKCIDPKNAEVAFEGADVVFRGTPIMIKRTFPQEDGQQSKWNFVEEVTFVVKKAWKGTGVGAHLDFKTGPALFQTCGMSVLNDPEWFGYVPTSGERAHFGDDWIVFASGSEPYQLNSCSMSGPVWTVFKDREEELPPVNEAELDRIARTRRDGK